MFSLIIVLTSAAPVEEEMVDQTNPSGDQLNDRIRQAAGRKKNDWTRRRFGRSTSDQSSPSLETQGDIDENSDQEAAASANHNWMTRRFGRSVSAQQIVEDNEPISIEPKGETTKRHTMIRREAGRSKHNWVNRRFGRSASSALNSKENGDRLIRNRRAAKYVSYIKRRFGRSIPISSINTA